MVSTDEGAVAAHRGHLAHLGHLGQAAGEFADDFLFVAAQRVDIDSGRAKVDASRRQVAHLIHHRSHMQQRLTGDAAHVQAHAAELGVALDQHNLEAEVGRAEGGAVAAGAAAEHEQVALQIGTACKTRRYWIDSCLRLCGKRWGLFLL